MALVSVHSLGVSLQSSFGVSVTRASPDRVPVALRESRPSFPSLSAPAAASPGLGAMSRGTPARGQLSPELRNSSSSKEPCL